MIGQAGVGARTVQMAPLSHIAVLHHLFQKAPNVVVHLIEIIVTLPVLKPVHVKEISFLKTLKPFFCLPKMTTRGRF